MSWNIMKYIFSASIFLIAMAAQPSLAYIGPGPGLSMIGSFFTLVAAIAIALFFVLLYPIRLLYKRRKQQKAQPTEPIE